MISSSPHLHKARALLAILNQDSVQTPPPSSPQLSPAPSLPRSERDAKMDAIFGGGYAIPGEADEDPL